MNINVTGYFNMDIIMDIDGYRYYNGYLMNMNGFQSQLQHIWDGMIPANDNMWIDETSMSPKRVRSVR